MTYSLGDAVVTVSADTSNLSRGIDGAKILMLGLGAAAAGAAGEALKLAGNFQQAQEMLVTSAGESQKNLAMISAGVLQVSTDTGTATDQLEAAMYKIESSGLHGKAALDALAAAAQGAKLENADLGTVADAETTIMTDFSSAHITAAQAMNDLIATVARGKSNIQDMAGAMSTVLPTANAVGVSLYDASAAMAVMTSKGTDAASAATYLKQLLIALEAPASKAAGTLKEIGLTTADVSDEMKKSLPDTLAMIEDHLKAKFPEGSAAYVEALKNIAGGSRQMQGILELTGGSLKTFEQDAKDVASAVKDGGTKVDGWAQIQGNFNLQLDKAHAALDAVFIKVGTQLMPIVSQFLTQDVDPAIAHFEDWATNTTGLHDTFVTLSGVLGTVASDVETLATDTAGVVNWFQQAGPQGTALKDVLVGVAGAVAMVKLSALAYDLQAFVTKIPDALIKYGLWTAATDAQATAQAAEATATEASTTQLTLWTGEAVVAAPAADALATSTDAAATAGSTAAAGFSSMLGPIGLATGAVLLAKQAWDGYTSSLQAGFQQQAQNEGLGVAGMRPDQGIPQVQAIVLPKIDTKGIEQANQDMRDLYRWISSLENYNPGGGVPYVNKAILQVQELKTHADDLAWPEVVVPINPYKIDKATGKVQYLKSQLDDLTASTWTANVQVMEAVSTRDDPGTISAGVPTITPFRGHAAGGIIGPGEMGTVAEPGTGSELVEGLAGGGARVYTNAQSRAMQGGGSSGGGGYGPLYLTLELDGRAFAAVTVPHIAPGIVSHMRLKTGVRI